VRKVYDEGLDPEELAFQRLYGPWQAPDLDETAALLKGIGVPWWVTGGWAVERFTGVRRPHADVDVSILARDLPALREHFAGRMHLWIVGSKTLRPLADDVTELPDWASQVWIREHALAPWLADVQVNPDRDGRWIFRRDPAYDFALDEVTWIDTDGLRLLNPEVAMAYKAKLHRPKDDADLAAALPLLDDRQRTWFYETVARLHPDHPWLSR
jgi:hypothetical protein